jgi:hypothetical protein
MLAVDASAAGKVAKRRRGGASARCYEKLTASGLRSTAKAQADGSFDPLLPQPDNTFVERFQEISSAR